jgi:hypothetical protein
MTYASITIAEQLTMADYRTVAEHLGPQPADGLVSEAAGCGQAGLHVITLWDSKAHHERFIGQRLLPAFEAAGVRPGPMTFTDIDIEALFLRTSATADC